MDQGASTQRPRGAIEYPNNVTVAEMFPPLRLDTIKASPLVRGMTPADLHDMELAFTTLEPSKNPKVGELKAEDLQSIENLFAEYRQAVIANFTGFPNLESTVRSGHLRLSSAAADGASCCCCCTPCCSCSAATEVSPFDA